MAAVILVMVPLTIPKIFGLQIYAVLTGSMTPAYSVGSVVYVKEQNIDDLQEGDVITFRMGSGQDYVMTHRIVEIDFEKKNFMTKGDANNEIDPEPVNFQRVIGKVVFQIPGIAAVSEYIATVTGKAVLFVLFAGALMAWMIADILCPDIRKDQKEKKEKKEKKGKRLSKEQVLRIVGILCVLGAGGYLAVIFFQYRSSELEYAALQNQVFSGTVDNQENMSTEQETEKEGYLLCAKQLQQAVEELKESNPDTVGWIAFDHLEISYPLMQGEDNDFYLRRTFSGESNSAGSIFIEAANHANLEDSHTIIYGHNMKNQTMFGTLDNYKTEDFYAGNEYFTIYTDQETYRYHIFSCYDISEYGDIYKVWYTKDAEEGFDTFVQKMKDRSYYDTGVEVGADDKILTLSTCSSKGKRFVIHAKRVQ